MIGNTYSSPGINVNYTSRGWSASVRYHDSGHADSGQVSTEGTLSTRYAEGGSHAVALAKVIDTIKADAERLGIGWQAPYVFVEFLEAAENYPERFPKNWEALIAEQARRIGWYTLCEDTATKA